MTKLPEYHPEGKKIIEATLRAWNNSSIVGEQVKLQNQEIAMLRVSLIPRNIENIFREE
jgi:hypothetical protein